MFSRKVKLKVYQSDKKLFTGLVAASLGGTALNSAVGIVELGKIKNRVSALETRTTKAETKINALFLDAKETRKNTKDILKMMKVKKVYSSK